MGRASEYNEEAAAQICAELSLGRSLRSVCQADDMPSTTTIFKWLNQFPQFAEQYARAKQEAADSFADEIVEIADRPDLDANDKRVRVDARKWVASKLKPKKYGDKIETTHELGETISKVVREIIRG